MQSRFFKMIRLVINVIYKLNAKQIRHVKVTILTILNCYAISRERERERERERD